jgi:nanoRNase/pAp phosphatase (c-di-AMP/oligoRNAs hydrolase)
MRVFGELKPRRALVMTHRSADVDGIASALAMKGLLSRLRKGVKVDLVAPGGVSAQSKKVLDSVGERFLETIPRAQHDLIVITDTGHSALLQEELEAVRRKKGRKLLVDHHPLDSSMKTLVEKAFVDEGSSSASEMAYRLFQEYGVKPDRKVGFIMALGIMADSQFLTIAKSGTIITMAELVKLGVDIDSVRSLLRYRREASEQIARIKAAKRATFYRCGDWVVGLSTVGSYHASVARALIDLGCDLSFASGEADSETRASVRAGQYFYSTTKLHVGQDVCRKMADDLGGSGGGHPTAGSLNCGRPPEEVQKLFLRLIEDLLGEGMRAIV